MNPFTSTAIAPTYLTTGICCTVVGVVLVWAGIAGVSVRMEEEAWKKRPGVNGSLWRRARDFNLKQHPIPQKEASNV